MLLVCGAFNYRSFIPVCRIPDKSFYSIHMFALFLDFRDQKCMLFTNIPVENPCILFSIFFCTNFLFTVLNKTHAKYPPFNAGILPFSVLCLWADLSITRLTWLTPHQARVCLTILSDLHLRPKPASNLSITTTAEVWNSTMFKNSFFVAFPKFFKHFYFRQHLSFSVGNTTFS